MDGPKRRTPAGPGEGFDKSQAVTDRLPIDSTAADRLLPRLDRCRQTGPESWTARCPAHEDRSPSLSIKQADDRILIHCHAGCSASDITAAVGLSLADLFDKPRQHHRGPVSNFKQRRENQAYHFLKSITQELLVVLIAADRQSAGYRLSGDDMDRLHEAHDYITRGLRLVINTDQIPSNPPPELKRPLDYLPEVMAEFGYTEGA